MPHLYAILVHESPDCILDLLRALRQHDPESHILLYNGGTDAQLLSGLPLEDLRVHTYPAPRPMRWGTLHGFALDCMRYALAKLPFQAMTIVDSDQMPLRAGWSAAVGATLAADPRLGLLSSEPTRQYADTKIDPVRTLYAERDLWLPLLRRLPGGEAAFAHWTFWPGTVFTRDAAAALVQVFDTDAELHAILAQSGAWATEEVLLPTLVAALGFGIGRSPTAMRWVQFRRTFAPAEAEAARADPTAFWIHPVTRTLNDPLRIALRPAVAPPQAGLLRSLPIIAAMQKVEGWLTEPEADLLIGALNDAARRLPLGEIAEIGSWCGRSTVVLASVLRALNEVRLLHAIDPHEGEVSIDDGRIQRNEPTLLRLNANLAAAGIAAHVNLRIARSTALAWHDPMAFLFVDGLHDEASVAADVAHFAPHLLPGALVAFHDYADYWPGVMKVVDGLVTNGGWTWLDRADSLVVLRREGARAAPHIARRAAPLVSAIMPTADREAFVPRAIQTFLRQDYAEKELVIVDDGVSPIAHLVPDDPRLRLIRFAPRLTVGAKRNIACEAARGDIMLHWDDDDWHAQDRLSRQVSAMEAAGAELCGSTTQLFLDRAAGQAWRYDYAALGDPRPWLAGGTLAYRASRWRRDPFEEVDVGEDARFVRAEPACIRSEVLGDVVVGMIHDRNVSPKRPRAPLWRQVALEDLAKLMGEDWVF